MADPGSITATAMITPPAGPAVAVPGFLNQNFVDGPDGVVPSGAPVWTFRYTPRSAGAFSAYVTVTTFNGTTASSSATTPQPFTITTTTAPGYKGFVEIDTTPGDQSRYYQYSQTKTSFYAAGSDIDEPELSDASQLPAEPGLFGGTSGTEATVNGVATAGTGSSPATAKPPPTSPPSTSGTSPI